MPQAIGYALVLLSKYKELADKCSSNNLLLKYVLNVIFYFFQKKKKKKKTAKISGHIMESFSFSWDILS